MLTLIASLMLRSFPVTFINTGRILEGFIFNLKRKKKGCILVQVMLALTLFLIKNYAGAKHIIDNYEKWRKMD